jgi:hypothetical protein
MEIISHRGYWKNFEEKNSSVAFKRSFDLNFGTEADLRDFNGDIVISHDIPDINTIKLADFFEMYNTNGQSTTLALNVKSDGLQKLLKSTLDHFCISNYFVFDMSIPDTIGYYKEGITFFSRQSEFEPIPVFYDKCKGIWLDSFEGIWYNEELILKHLNHNKQVALVSPELHKRDYIEFWSILRDNKIHQMKGVILCTDFPEIANNYFK